MKVNRLLILLALLPLTAFADTCKTHTPINLDAYAADIRTRNVTFMAIDFKRADCLVINEQGLTQRHSPYSTFKIPHTLIALETGVVKSIDERIEWDRVKRPAQDHWPKTWQQSQTLATAFKRSAVWYYQELVPRIGSRQYKTWLSQFHYGDQFFTPDSDTFWLNGELRISPEEQVEFLTCLLKNQCGIKESTFSAFESVALQETKNGFSLYAKTGTGPIDPNNYDGAFEGWYVGYIKDTKDKPVTAFALFMTANSFSALKDFRRELSLRLLADKKLWPR